MRVAITHDYLTQRGGAERVVLGISDIFPHAPIHTSLYAPDATFDEFRIRDVRPSRANAIGPLRDHHRVALPLYPLILRTQPIEADVTICSSSGWAHGARVSGKKLVYCHAPARWLYQGDTYLAGFPSPARLTFPLLRPALLHWDRRAAATADRYVANSTHTRNMIRDAYGIDAEVLAPPHSIDPAGPQTPVEGCEPGFHLTVSRLLSYKNVPQVVEAFRRMPDERLMVVGEGPLRDELEAGRPPNVALLGTVDDAELSWLYANATALVAVSYEDLGLTPVEAALFGTPTLAIRYGGYLDTIVEGVNGLFMDDPSPRSIRAAVEAFDGSALDEAEIRRSTERFSRPTFEARLRELVAEELNGA